MLKIWSKLQKKYTKEELALFDFFRSNFLFKDLKNKELVHVIEAMHLRTYKENEIVFFRDDPALAVYFIKNGEVLLDCEFGEEKEMLAHCNSSDVFGFGSFAMKTPRLFNATVTSHSAEIYLWPTVSIRELFAKHPEIQGKIQHELVRFYEGYTQNLFHTYRESYGFFQLKDLYDELYDNE